MSAGIVLSLLWNLGNSIYTQYSNKKTRRCDFLLSQFVNQISAPIESKLDDIEELEVMIRGVFMQEDMSIQREELLNLQTQQIIPRFLGLDVALRRADNQSFVKGKRLADIAQGYSDDVLTSISVIVNPHNNEPIISKNREILISKIGDLRREISTRLLETANIINKGKL